MRKELTLVFLNVLLTCVCKICNAQSTIQETEKRFTPSPVVANIGLFGGSVDLKKSSGAINTSIPLFKVNQGDISYSPALEYYSSGILVNDWGGRLGMSWTDKFTCVISRTVHSIPDEGATARIDLPPSEMEQITNENLSRVSMLALPATMQGADAEYDIYTYNIFGEVGSFIIKESGVVLLNHDKPINIEIVESYPLSFCVTAVDGMKYYFGLNGEVEVTSYDGENSCDYNAPMLKSIPTAWFLSKIVSPLKEVVLFDYSYTKSFYIYDEKETNNVHFAYDWERGCINEDEDEQEHTFCMRRKTSETPLLESISAENFEISFQYINRSDFPGGGDKLLKDVIVRNSIHEIINQVSFVYDHTVSTRVLEQKIQMELAGQTDDMEAIRHRYFLSSIQIGYPAAQTYSFEYYSPELLPHRFSFSQDILGFYNGKSNNGLIPADKVQAYIGVSNRDWTLPINTGDRSCDTVAKYGLLKKIIYPTKGYDLIHYELNTKMVTESSIKDTIIREEVERDENVKDWTYYPELFYLPPIAINNNTYRVGLSLNVDYDGVPIPNDGEYDLYRVEFAVYNITYETIVPIPDADSDGYVTRYIFQYYSQPLYLPGGKEYQLIFKVYNYNTYFTYKVDYKCGYQTYNVERPYYGNRVSKIETVSSQNVKQTRRFDYRLFTKNGGVLNYSNVPSIEIPNDVNGYVRKVTIVDPDLNPPYCYLTVSRRWYLFSSDNNYHKEVYNGMAYSYSCVTEYFNENKTSFIASQFQVASNESGGVLIGDYTASVPLSNLGWNNGLEVKRFYGAVEAGVFLIKKEMSWDYSVGSSSITHNYVVITYNHNLPSSGDPHIAFRSYQVIHAPQYSFWYKLNYMEEKNYGSGGIVTMKTNYNYNTNNKLLQTESFVNSEKKTRTIQYLRPHDMVENGNDPTGVYSRMKSAYMIAPIIEQSTLLDGQTIEAVRRNYNEPYTGLYLPSSVESWTNDIREKKLTEYKYNDRGNIVEIRNSNGPATSFIWSYGGQHPFAMLKNANYVDVERLIGVNTLTLFRDNLYPTQSALNNIVGRLRASSIFKDSEITSYSFKPHAGIATLIDAKGEETSYDYDQFLRLKNIKDHNSKIVKKYEYHYK